MLKSICYNISKNANLECRSDQMISLWRYCKPEDVDPCDESLIPGHAI